MSHDGFAFGCYNSTPFKEDLRFINRKNELPYHLDDLPLSNENV